MSERTVHASARSTLPTVWIVDDSPMETQLVMHTLGPGYRIEIFGDGSSLLEHIARSPQRPDVLLLDWVMPDISGEEICRFLRANPETAGLSIILLTASRLAVADVVAGLSAGADDYVSKPFAPEELRARVGAMLRAQRLREGMQRQSQRLELVALLAKRLTAAGPSVPAVLNGLCSTLITVVCDGCLVWTDLMLPVGRRFASLCHGDPKSAAVIQALLHAELEHQFASESEGDARPRFLNPSARRAAKALVPPQLHAYLDEFEIRGLALLPLRDLNGVRGTVAVWRGPSKEGFSEDDLALLETCLDYCALTLQNAQLYEAEQRMRARLDATLDQLPVGVIVADEHGQTCLRNRISREILGDSMELDPHFTELQQNSRYESPSGEIYPPDQMPLARALAGEVVLGEEVVVRLPGGVLRTLRASGAPVLSEDGARVGGVVAFEDISEQKAAAREREQVAQFQAQFIGIIGHDLRNPLSAIKMATIVLGHQVGKDNPLLTRIAASSERMRRIIDQLLDLTRARLGGGILLATKLVNIVEVTRNVIDELQTAYPQSRFDCQLDPVPLGEWDEGRLEQVLSNVISNAVLHGHRDHPVKIRLRHANGEAVCEVHNENSDGKAIPPEVLRILFEPFRRGRDEQQHSQGLGLGLFIAHEIVGAHRGRIEVQSTADQGTIFRIILPLHKEAGVA